MTTAQPKNYFAAINSSQGFHSLFEDVFFHDGIKCRYIIKGGPGTGKSSLMRREAKRAENAGHDVEYYYCSSDTASLDGIVIDGSIAMLDGTAPHSYDTRLPGAVDSIINLGEYWNEELLASRAREIQRLVSKKKAAYDMSYDHLRAAGVLSALMADMITPCVQSEKMSAAAARLVRKSHGRPSGQVRECQVSAFGTKGRVHFDTLAQMSEKRTAVCDYYGTAHLLMGEICRRATDSGMDVYVSRDTVCPSRINELYIPETGEYFGGAQEAHSTVNMKRFVDRGRLSEARTQYRKVKQAYDSILSLAAESLAAAGALHASIEKYYILAMDFERMKGKEYIKLTK